MMLGDIATFSTTSLLGEHHADVEGAVNEGQVGRVSPFPSLVRGDDDEEGELAAAEVMSRFTAGIEQGHDVASDDRSM